MRKISLLLFLAVLFLAPAGCKTETSTIFSGGYWVRHFKKFGQDLHEFRVDIDRIFFDLDDRPIESL